MRGKPNWDWVPFRSYGQFQQVTTASAVAHLSFVAPAFGAQEAPQVGQPDDVDEMTVHRVVGQIMFQFLEGTAVTSLTGNDLRLALRLTTTLQDPTGAFAVYPNSLFAGTDANESFMWQRYFAFPEGATPPFSFGTPADDPGWFFLDVRAKRRVDSMQAVSLLAQIADGVGNRTVEVAHFLRALVKKK